MAVMGASTGLAKERWPAERASARTRVFSTAAQTKPASSSAAPLQGPASRSSGRSRRCQAWGPRSVSTARSRRSPSAATAQTLPKGSSQTGVISQPGGTRGAASKRASPRRTSAHPAHQTSPQRVASIRPGGPSGTEGWRPRDRGGPVPRMAEDLVPEGHPEVAVRGDLQAARGAPRRRSPRSRCVLTPPGDHAPGAGDGGVDAAVPVLEQETRPLGQALVQGLGGGGKGREDPGGGQGGTG